MESRIIAAIALSAAFVAPHMARADGFDHTLVWYKKADAFTTCVRDVRIDITVQFGAANAYKAEEWCNTNIKYMNCIEDASSQSRGDVVKHVRSLPECVNMPLPRNIAFDDIAQWVADQRLKELNEILLPPATVTASPK